MNYAWTNAGPVKVLKEEETRVKVLLPGRKRGKWISKTQIVQAPEKTVFAKKVNFDMACGCTAVAEVTPTSVTCYNVYGSLKKYLESEQEEASSLSHHHQRKHLKENGFTRSRSLAPREITDSAKEGFRLLSKKGKNKAAPSTYKMVKA
jgi:hypothetical protein